jgi:hypothetical protein
LADDELAGGRHRERVDLRDVLGGQLIEQGLRFRIERHRSSDLPPDSG